MSQTKKCYECKEVFPIENFNKDNHVKSGLSSKCKSCLSIYHKELRKKMCAQEKNILTEKECLLCKIIKPSTEFVKNKGSKSGLTIWCKQCIKIKREETKVKNKNKEPKIIIIPDNKTCSLCNNEKPSTEFIKNNRSKDGLNCKCKECSKKTRKINKIPETKNCSSCSKILPNNYFQKDITASCGLSSKCRKCKNQEVVNHREKIKIKNIKKEQDGILLKEKICSVCKNTKSIDNFTKCKTNKDGYNSYCKDCRKILDKKRKENAQNNIVEIDKNKTKTCIKCDIEKSYSQYRICRTSNDKLSHICNECQPPNNWTKEKQKESGKKYIKNNPDKIKEKYKRQSLRNNMRSRIICALKTSKINKNNTTIHYIGCEIPFLKKWLEYQFIEGMTWKNQGKWHIDHVKPCSSFDLHDEVQLKECFNWKNLQPLWGSDNCSKSNKIDNDLIAKHKIKADNYKKLNCFIITAENKEGELLEHP